MNENLVNLIASWLAEKSELETVIAVANRDGKLYTAYDAECRLEEINGKLRAIGFAG